MPGLTYVERHSTSPGMEYFVYGCYDKLKSCGDNVFVLEKTNLNNNGSEFAKSNESYALIDSSKAATSYEYLNTLMSYNYMYDESDGYYSGTKGDSYIHFTVGEGKITSYYDSLGYSKTRKTIPSDALSLINEDLYPVESNNGVYTSGAKTHNSGCNHSFIYHFKDENNPETYVECEYCDFTTKGCSDLTNVDDDKLSRAQLASLILNSKLSFRQMLFGKPVDEHFFYKDNVIIRYAGGNDYQYWFYKNVNDDTVYYDKKFFSCSDLETLKKTPELASEKGFYFSNDVIYNIDSRYPLNFACLEFVYNSSTQTYNYNWNGTVASINCFVSFSFFTNI